MHCNHLHPLRTMRCTHLHPLHATCCTHQHLYHAFATLCMPCAAPICTPTYRAKHPLAHPHIRPTNCAAHPLEPPHATCYTQPPFRRITAPHFYTSCTAPSCGGHPHRSRCVLLCIQGAKNTETSLKSKVDELELEKGRLEVNLHKQKVQYDQKVQKRQGLCTELSRFPPTPSVPTASPAASAHTGLLSTSRSSTSLLALV